MLAREQTTGDRVVGDHADAFVEAEREQLAFELAEHEVVSRLHGVEAREAERGTLPESLCESVSEEIRAADVAHFAGAYEIVECSQRFLERYVPVVEVELVQVDEVGLQAAE